ncbi:hypothetical protein ABZW44_09425 [Streptomyces mirabilis]|uniref:hypothetical protein n=1 Tax=Streptomyces mirabilis TaxID=68239 RepID=UPI0033A06E64
MPERVEFLPRRFLVSLRVVDPLGDDGEVGWPRVILNTVLLAISFFRPSAKRDWRAMGAQY